MAEKIHFCTQCGKGATDYSVKTDFYISYSKTHKNLRRTHLCKDCIISNSLDGVEFNSKKFVDTLTVVDKPYIPMLVDSSIEETYKVYKDEGIVKENILKEHGDVVVGLYMKNVGMRQYKGMTFRDGEQVADISDDEKIIAKLKTDKFDLVELVEKYGYGHPAEDYYNFERKYNKLTIGYREKTSLHTEGLITYIIHKVKEETATANGDVTEAEKWSRMTKTDATSAKINVSQLSKSDITGGIDLIPQLAEAMEERLSLIPVMPKLRAIPYDDADMIIWALTNYNRRLEEKPEVSYAEVYGFYDNFLEEYFRDEKGLAPEQVEIEKKKRNNVFKDLGERYYEPIYDSEKEENENREDIEVVTLEEDSGEGYE